jgi:membrane associated rhomboid family serine protease
MSARGDNGGRIGGPPSRSFFGHVPPSVAIFAIVLTGVYAALEAAPDAIAVWANERFGLSPERLFAGADAPGGLLGALAPLLTHMLIHASLPHLLFNLLWLLVFGAPVARRLRSAGRFGLFFALSGAAGGLFFSIFHPNDATLLVGASGGITGLLGGVVRFAFHPSGTILPLRDRSVLTWTALVILLNATIPVIGPPLAAGEAPIAWQAHIGGFLFGLLAFPLFDRKN